MAWLMFHRMYFEKRLSTEFYKVMCFFLLLFETFCYLLDSRLTGFNFDIHSPYTSSACCSSPALQVFHILLSTFLLLWLFSDISTTLKISLAPLYQWLSNVWFLLSSSTGARVSILTLKEFNSQVYIVAVWLGFQQYLLNKFRELNQISGKTVSNTYYQLLFFFPKLSSILTLQAVITVNHCRLHWHLKLNVFNTSFKPQITELYKSPFLDFLL